MVKKNKGGNHINDAHKKPKQQEVVEESNGKRDIGLTIDDDRLGKIDDICPPCKKKVLLVIVILFLRRQ